MFCSLNKIFSLGLVSVRCMMVLQFKGSVREAFKEKKSDKYCFKITEGKVPIKFEKPIPIPVVVNGF